VELAPTPCTAPLCCLRARNQPAKPVMPAAAAAGEAVCGGGSVRSTEPAAEAGGWRDMQSLVSAGAAQILYCTQPPLAEATKLFCPHHSEGQRDILAHLTLSPNTHRGFLFQI
jgi:hypothetical protein